MIHGIYILHFLHSFIHSLIHNGHLGWIPDHCHCECCCSVWEMCLLNILLAFLLDICSRLPERMVAVFLFYRKLTLSSLGAVLFSLTSCEQLTSVCLAHSSSPIPVVPSPTSLTLWMFVAWSFLLWLDGRLHPSTLWAECQDKVWSDFPEISLVLEITSWARWLFKTKVQFPPLLITPAISEGASSTYPGADRSEEGQRRQHSCCWRGWEVTD